jgi:type III secretion system YscQ/HrcQ family protein
VDALADELVIAPIVAQIGDQRVLGRAFVPSAMLRDPRTANASADFSWLEGVAITLWADAGSATLPLMAARALEAGDVVVLDASALVYEEAAFHGQITLRVQGGSATLTCNAHDHTISIDTIDAREDTHMTTGHVVTKTEQASAALASDVPIELHVELARFSLPLGELARLAPGDVLTTGRRIGEHVTLRAGTRALAEGELVDVDGEIGVRVLRVLATRDQSEIV